MLKTNDIKIKNIDYITLQQATKIYMSLNISFIVKDGKLKGLSNK